MSHDLLPNMLILYHYIQYHIKVIYQVIPSSDYSHIIEVNKMQCLQLSDLGQVKVRINLKRIIDENGIIKNEIIVNSLH